MTKTTLSPPRKENIGKIATELQEKSDLQSDSIELQREIHKGSNSKKTFEEELMTTVKRGMDDPKIDGNFFVVVLNKKERLLQNIVRQYFFYRQSCPSPDFDQTVYRVYRKSGKVQYLWTVPDNVTCNNLPHMKKDLPPEQLQLVYMTESFNCGALDRYADMISKEKDSE